MTFKMIRHVWPLLVLLFMIPAYGQENEKTDVQGIHDLVTKIEKSIGAALSEAGYPLSKEAQAIGLTPLDQNQWHFLLLIDTSQASPGTPDYIEFCTSFSRYFLYRRAWLQDKAGVPTDKRHLISCYPFQLDLYREGAAYIKEAAELNSEMLKSIDFRVASLPLRSDESTPYVGGKDYQKPRAEAISEALANSSLPLIVVQLASQAASDPVIGRGDNGSLLRDPRGNRSPANLGPLGDTQGLSLVGDFVPYSTNGAGKAYVLTFVPSLANQAPAAFRALSLAGVSEDEILKDAVQEIGNGKVVVPPPDDIVVPPPGFPWVPTLIIGALIIAAIVGAFHLLGQTRTVLLGPTRVPLTAQPFRPVHIYTRNEKGEVPDRTCPFPPGSEGTLSTDKRIFLVDMSLFGEVTVRTADGISMTVDDFNDLASASLRKGESKVFIFTESATDQTSEEIPISVGE